jgi:hypothetical protein
MRRARRSARSSTRPAHHSHHHSTTGIGSSRRTSTGMSWLTSVGDLPGSGHWGADWIAAVAAIGWVLNVPQPVGSSRWSQVASGVRLRNGRSCSYSGSSAFCDLASVISASALQVELRLADYLAYGHPPLPVKVDGKALPPTAEPCCAFCRSILFIGLGVGRPWFEAQ